MLFEVIREIMIEPHPQPGISIGNQFHKLPPRIAYIDLRIVSCATPALFFTFPHCTSRINHYLYPACRGDLSGLPLFYFRRRRCCSRVNRCFFLVRECLGAIPVWRRLFHEGCWLIKSSIAFLKAAIASTALFKSEKSY